MSSSSEDVIVYPRDLPPAGLCVSGARRWFTAQGRPDLFRTFVKQGLPASTFRSFNDALGDRAAASAEARAAASAEAPDAPTGDPAPSPDAENGLIIRRGDLQLAGMCPKGARDWCREHDRMDLFEKLLRGRLTVAELRQVDDLKCQELCTQVERNVRPQEET